MPLPVERFFDGLAGVRCASRSFVVVMTRPAPFLLHTDMTPLQGVIRAPAFPRS
jgi:hypothetical protein